MLIIVDKNKIRIIMNSSNNFAELLMINTQIYKVDKTKFTNLFF